MHPTGTAESCQGLFAGTPAPTGFTAGLKTCAEPVGAGLPANGPLISYTETCFKRSLAGAGRPYR
ncbi:hypothetical protein DZC31_11125 [Stenotrophomonas rhizophila]|nr:hypothetical protein DZC31_11125 [Stenotrophomonas rhizophila]